MFDIGYTFIKTNKNHDNLCIPTASKQNTLSTCTGNQPRTNSLTTGCAGNKQLVLATVQQ